MPGLGLPLGLSFNPSGAVGASEQVPTSITGDWTAWMKNVLTTPNGILASQWPTYDDFYAIDNFLYAIDDIGDVGSGETLLGFLIFPAFTNGSYAEFEKVNYGRSKSHTPLIPAGIVHTSGTMGRFPNDFTVWQDQDGDALRAFRSTRPGIGVGVNEGSTSGRGFSVTEEYSNAQDCYFKYERQSTSIDVSLKFWNMTPATTHNMAGSSSGLEGYYHHQVFSTGVHARRERQGGAPAGIAWTVAAAPASGATSTLKFNEGETGTSLAVGMVAIGQKLIDTFNTTLIRNMTRAFDDFITNGNSFTYAGYPWSYNPANYPVPVY